MEWIQVFVQQLFLAAVRKCRPIGLLALPREMILHRQYD
jgi:hypothetical protein